MTWLGASIALLVFVMLAIYFAYSRKTVLATLVLFAALVLAAAALLYYESWQSEQRVQRVRGLVGPADIEISDATLTREYGSWRLKGTLANRSQHPVTSITLAITVQNCPGENQCDVIGSDEASAYGLNVPPGESRAFNMLVYLPDMPQPAAMKWAYEVREVRADTR
jgi:hypothetical protein